MTLPWKTNIRLRSKKYTIGVNFRGLTQDQVEWIQTTYTTAKKDGTYPSQFEVAEKASKRFKTFISVGLVQKAVNVTEISRDE